MHRRIVVAVITLAILAPGLIAGTVVASYFIHHRFTAPPLTTVLTHQYSLDTNLYRYRNWEA